MIVNWAIGLTPEPFRAPAEIVGLFADVPIAWHGKRWVEGVIAQDIRAIHRERS
jgi:hypothetical protein